mmetsp:Transcript_32109/g.78018  ORF Transcript_32109/g.78018 Transcript_32109/m.78018 type:complete len:759 (-) Transcript_32109:2558-4834(-)
MATNLVTLPDGRTVDLDTAEATNAILQQEGYKGMFTDPVKKIKKIRKKKAGQRLNQFQKNQLLALHKFMDSFPAKSDPGLFRGSIAESEIKCWLDYTIGEIKRFTKMKDWIQNGDLEDHDEVVLNPCVTMFTHPVPVALVFESDFFEALADFVKARKNSSGRGMPTKRLCALITAIICEAFVSCTTRCDTNWLPEIAFKLFEKCGVLEQYIRCITPPQPPDCLRAQQMLIPLQSCPGFLKKKFKKGEPCGDTLQAILDGNDGSPEKAPEIIQRLEWISRSVNAMKSRAETGIDSLGACGNCGNMDRSDGFQKALMRCTRCKSIHYCSKECQRADWKQHKKVCKPIPKATKIRKSAINTDLHVFCNRHYNYMMIRMVEACDHHGLKMKDMVVELDYTTNTKNVIPAIQDPPIFKIVPFRDYGEGSEESDWLLECKETKPKYYEELIADMKMNCSKPTPNTLMFLVNHMAGSACVGQIEQKLNENALDAYRTAINKGDFGPLSKILRSDVLELAQGMISVGVDEVYEFLRHKNNPTARMKFAPNKLRDHFIEFSEKHYVKVMADIVENEDLMGLKMQDLVIELDFAADIMVGGMNAFGGYDDGMFEYSNFNVVPLNRYSDGSRPKESDWFPDKKNPLAFEKKKNDVITLFQKKARKPSGEATVLVNYAGGVFVDPQIAYEIPLALFTLKALNAFKSAINDVNLKPLSEVFPCGVSGIYIMDLFLYGIIPEAAAMAALPPEMLREMHGGQMVSDDELFGDW